MKKFLSSFLTVLLLAGMAPAAHAMFSDREENWTLSDKPETVYNPYTEHLDDSINLTYLKDGTSVGLTKKLNMQGGKLTVEIKLRYGYTVSATPLTDNVTVHAEQVRSHDIPTLRDYNYVLLTIEPSADDAEMGEFRIHLVSGEADFTLYGEAVPQEVDYIVPGARQSVNNGVEYRYYAVDEDKLWWKEDDPDGYEAVMVCPNGLELVFQGDYGDGSANLTTDTVFIPEAKDLPGTTEACWTFTESPSFENEITVRVKASMNAKVYNALHSGAHLIDADYADGYLSFETTQLNAYILQDETK